MPAFSLCRESWVLPQIRPKIRRCAALVIPCKNAAFEPSVRPMSLFIIGWGFACPDVSEYTEAEQLHFHYSRDVVYNFLCPLRVFSYGSGKPLKAIPD